MKQEGKLFQRFSTSRRRFADKILLSVRGGSPQARELLHNALCRVPRHLFVEPTLEHRAYSDIALPIGMGQTISRPSTVALMLLALNVRPGSKILEIGSGSGYAAALLGAMGASVTAVEFHPELARSSAERLRRLQYTTVRQLQGDGLRSAFRREFDGVLVSTAITEFPERLWRALIPRGRLVCPIRVQSLYSRSPRPSAVERQYLYLFQQGQDAIALSECSFVLAA